MLYFYGLEHKDGQPQRFSYRLELLDAINSVLKLVESKNSDFDLCLDSIKMTIESLFQQKKIDSLSATRSRLKHLYLQRDILNFINQHKTNWQFLLQLFELLLKSEPVNQKWPLVRNLITQYYLNIDHTSFQNELLHTESFLFSALQITRLCFLDQITEKPPANLRLLMVNNKFPKHSWYSGKYGGYRELLDWQPSAKECGLNYLQVSLWQNFLQQRSSVIKKLLHTNSNFTFDKQILDYLKQNKQNLAINDNEQDNLDTRTKIDIEDSVSRKIKSTTVSNYKITELRWEQSNNTPSLIPSRPWESFYAFQDYLSKNYDNLGVLIFYAILRQTFSFTEGSNLNSSLDVGDYLDLFNLTKSKNTIKIKAHWQKTLKILDDISKIEVIRQSEQDESLDHNKLLVVLGFSIGSDVKSLPSKLHLALDDLFFGQNELGILPLGLPYALIPSKFFTLKIPPSVKEILKVMVYFTTTLIFNLKSNKSELSQNLKEIIEGSNLEVTKSSKYRVVYKILAIIRYMKENELIADYHVQNFDNKPPWESLCLLYPVTETTDTMKELVDSKILLLNDA